ncbi:hypothetical protein [Phreatobacter sp.]|uniref:hypothetical protein n=1 Tax=Phreatobacter sp. TaxID=1966341 RepID=UPI003F70F791
MTQALVITRWLSPAELERNWATEERQVRSAVSTIGGAKIVELNPGSGLIAIEGDRAFQLDAAREALSSALPGWDVGAETTFRLPALSR